MVETLNEIAQMRDSGFGRPWPRHGLKLLYWFANECIHFENNNRMRSKYDPDEGYFGFHHFKNRYYQSGERLLPDVDIPYYVVGNLNSPGANQLPSYVSEDYSTSNDGSNNTDRIIISLDNDDWIENVYVTDHIDNSNYDPNATFRISRGLLIIFKSNTLDNLLLKTGYHARQPQRPVPDVFLLPFPKTIQQSFKPGTTLNPVVSPASTNPLQQFDKERLPTSNPALVSQASPSPVKQNVDKGPPSTAQTNDTTIQIETHVYKLKTRVSENEPYRNKTFWDMCAIL